jgi:hypothetical protein
VSVLLVQSVPRDVRQIAEPDPDVTPGRTGEVLPPDLLVFLRQVGIDAVRVECLRPPRSRFLL